MHRASIRHPFQFGLICLLAANLLAQSHPETRADSVMRAQQEWRFGVFLHFNMNTFSPGWANDRVDPRLFNPTNLDCGQWARTFKAAGMKFAMLTAKHHDGFTLWPSRAVPPNGKALYTIAQSSVPTRDVVKEYCDSMRAYGIEPGIYYSPWDTGNGVKGDWAKEKTYILTQLTELLGGKYGKIPLFVTDAWDWKMGHIAIPYDVIKDTVRKMQPTCMMVGHNAGGSPWHADVLYFECPKGDSAKAPAGNTYASIQSPTISGNWFWDAAAEDTNRLLSTTAILNWLTESESRYCNLAINCPPSRKGLMPDAIVKRLAQVGAQWRPNLARPPLPHQMHNIEYPIARKACAASSNGTMDYYDKNKYPTAPLSVSDNVADGHYDIDGKGFISLWAFPKPFYWKSANGLPQWAQLDLGAVYYNLNIFGYLPRRNGQNRSGLITSYRLQLSNDNVTFTEIARGKWNGKDYRYQTIEFAPTQGRYVRLIADSTADSLGNRGGTFAVLEEIDIGGRLIRPTLTPSRVIYSAQGSAVSQALPVGFRIFGNHIAVPAAYARLHCSAEVYDLSGKFMTAATIKNGSVQTVRSLPKTGTIYIVKIKK